MTPDLSRSISRAADAVTTAAWLHIIDRAIDCLFRWVMVTLAFLACCHLLFPALRGLVR